MRIDVSNDLPGIAALFAYRPETGAALRRFAQLLLRGESPLSPFEREVVATYVSSRNVCRFCTESHAAAARALPGGDAATVDAVIADVATAPIAPKLRALLAVADEVRRASNGVSDTTVARARIEGATDRELHDVVLIAAAFSMFNRYVDGLAAPTPTDRGAYDAMGQMLATQGYTR